MIKSGSDERDHEHRNDVRAGLNQRQRGCGTLREHALRSVNHDAIGQREPDPHQDDGNQGYNERIARREYHQPARGKQLAAGGEHANAERRLTAERVGAPPPVVRPGQKLYCTAFALAGCRLDTMA